MIVKVDYEKAYDLVEWDFLEYMMSRLGFDVKWIEWIKLYLNSTLVLILINAFPTKEFMPSRGLRQGRSSCPIFDFIVAEGLARLVREAFRIGVLEEVRVAGRICLTKSVITALPLFYLSFFKVPKLVCKIIKSIQINFLWGWGSKGKKMPWVARNKIYAPVEVGGSSIRDIDRFNVALLAK